MDARAHAAPPLAARLLDPPHALPFARGGPLPAPLRPAASLGVLDVTKWFGSTSGGVRTYLLQKAAYVERHPRLRQTIVVPGARDLVGGGEGARCYQLASPPVPGQAPYRLLLAAGQLRRIARHERPHVIEAGSPLLVPWMAAAAARELEVPLVAFHHGLLPHNFAARAERAGPGRRAAAAAAWRYLRRLDRLFAVTLVGSAFAADELRRHGIERTVQVPLGVALELFHPWRRERADDTRRRFGLPVDRPLALFAGRLSPEKEVDVLVDAWPQVARRTGAVLAIVGDGPLRPRLERRAAGLPVAFVPFQSDRESVADLVAAADLYVSPGSIETFGLAAVEALACGTPVLTADRGAVAEHVARSGAGAAFAAGDAAELADAATSLIDRLSPALSERARAHAAAAHDWDRALDRIFEVYAELGAGRVP